jgi:hypothetical protein
VTKEKGATTCTMDVYFFWGRGIKWLKVTIFQEEKKELKSSYLDHRFLHDK